jgi:hypothetical protein
MTVYTPDAKMSAVMSPPADDTTLEQDVGAWRPSLAAPQPLSRFNAVIANTFFFTPLTTSVVMAKLSAKSLAQQPLYPVGMKKLVLCLRRKRGKRRDGDGT